MQLRKSWAQPQKSDSEGEEAWAQVTMGWLGRILAVTAGSYLPSGKGGGDGRDLYLLQVSIRFLEKVKGSF